MNVFDYTDYRKFLKDELDARKKTTPGFSSSSLSERINLQRSYLSNVLAGRAELNADQLYLISDQLNLGTDETEYLLLLLEIERCQVQTRKERLAKKRDHLQKEQRKSEKYLMREPITVNDESHAEYYANPDCSLIHILLTISRYRTDLELVARTLRLSTREVNEILNVLEKCGLLTVTKRGYEVSTRSMHLGESSRLTRSYATGFRLKAIEYQRRLDNPEDYFFTTTFSANEQVRLALKKKFMEVLRWLSGQVEKAPSEEAFHMNFDLFRV